MIFNSLSSQVLENVSDDILKQPVSLIKKR